MPSGTNNPDTQLLSHTRRLRAYDIKDVVNGIERSIGAFGINRSEVQDVRLLTATMWAVSLGFSEGRQRTVSKKVRSASQRTSVGLTNLIERATGIDVVQRVKAVKKGLMSEHAGVPVTSRDLTAVEDSTAYIVAGAQQFLEYLDNPDDGHEGLRAAIAELRGHLDGLPDDDTETLRMFGALDDEVNVDTIAEARDALVGLLQRLQSDEPPTPAQEVDPTSMGIVIPPTPNATRAPAFPPMADGSLNALVHKSMATRHRVNRNVIRVISDLHLGSSWHTPTNNAALLAVLHDMADPDTFVSTLIINGDIVERWLVPAEQEPPSTVEMMASPEIAPVVAAIKTVARNGVKIYYIPGNHDDDVTAADVVGVFGRAVHFVEGEDLVINGVRFTHGHHYDIVCRPYRYAEGGRPFAYYMSRCAASSGLDEGGATDGVRRLSANVTNRLFSQLLRVFTYRPAAHWAMVRMMTVSFQETDWEAIRHRPIHLPGDGSQVTVEAVMQQYMELMRNVRRDHGGVRAAAMARSSISGQYGHFLRRSPYLVEVFSHTHQPELRSYRRHKPRVPRTLPKEGEGAGWGPCLGNRKDGKAPRQLGTRVLYTNSGSFSAGRSSYVDIMVLPAKARLVESIPAHLLGLGNVRDRSAHTARVTSATPHVGGMRAFTSEAGRRIIGDDGSGRVGPTLLPYEVRVYRTAGDKGEFYLQKAKRVPYAADWTSRGIWATRHGNRFKPQDGERPASITGLDGRVAVPVTGTIRATERANLGINAACWDTLPIRQHPVVTEVRGANTV